MNSCYNDKFFHEKWGGSGRPSRPASDGPAFFRLLYQNTADLLSLVSSLTSTKYLALKANLPFQYSKKR